MKLIQEIYELKKGDTLIIKDNEYYHNLGFTSVKGEVFLLNIDELLFSVKCKETNSIDKINIKDGKFFLIS